MKPSDEIHSFLIGRTEEKKEFLKLLDFAQGKTQCLYKAGDGGIGKTLFLKWCIQQARLREGIIVLDLVDLFIPTLRTREGFMNHVASELEHCGFKREMRPFRQKYQDVPEVFHNCLLKICQKHILMLCVDTFELVAKEYLAQWILSDKGLLIQNLLLLIGSRPIPSLDENLPLQVIFSPVKPLVVKEAHELYCSLVPEADTTSSDLQMFISHMVAITDGHPLLLELAYSWLRGNLLSSDWLSKLDRSNFEKNIMSYAAENAYENSIRSHSKSDALSVPWEAFQVIVYMSYMHRHFDINHLKQLVAEGYIEIPDVVRVDDQHLSDYLKRLIDLMQQYFFVKVHTNGNLQLQLHDEMARLVETYVLPKWVWLKSDGQIGFGRYAVDLCRGQLGWKQVRPDILPIGTVSNNYQLISEYLAYALKLERLTNMQIEAGESDYFGIHLFNDLTELNDTELDKLILAEINQHFKELGSKSYYGSDVMWEIYQRLGELENRLTHYVQAAYYYSQALQLAQKAKKSEWHVRALMGLHDATWPSDPSTSIKNYLLPALAITKEYLPSMTPSVEYEIGFANRRLYHFKEAIRHYRTALDAVRQRGANETREAILLNDLGYLLPYTGEYDVAQEYVTQALKLRRTVYTQAKENLDSMQSQLHHASEKNMQDRLEEDKQQRLVARAESQLGLSYNTLGEIFRYRSRLNQAILYYSKSLVISRKFNNFRFQVRSLVGRAEAYRRLLQEQDEETQFGKKGPLDAATADLREAIYLCRKYPDLGEVATAYRRRGRLFHDRGNMLIKAKNQAEACVYFDNAEADFMTGLEEARKPQAYHALEELENAVELAFLLNDWLIATNETLTDELYSRYVGELELTLQRYAQIKSPDQPQIDLLPVFQYLLLLEKGACAFYQKNYDVAFANYIDGYIGLAQDPGYGSQRYNQHLAHFKDNILSLYTQDHNLAILWCETIIKTFTESKALLTGENEIYVPLIATQPNLPNWCQLQLNRWKNL